MPQRLSMYVGATPYASKTPRAPGASTQARPAGGRVDERRELREALSTSRALPGAIGICREMRPR